MLVKIGNHFPRDRGKNKKSLKISFLTHLLGTVIVMHFDHGAKKTFETTVDGWNPAPPRMYKTPVNI